MLKAAIIGAGFIADFHASAYRDLKDVSLEAVCDKDGERAGALAQKYGCRAFTDSAAMLSQVRPELVSVCVPTYLHLSCVLEALAHGANVLCEKPLALSVSDCVRMRDAAQSAGRVLMTGQVLRFWPGYTDISERLRLMGRPLFIEAKRLQHASRGGWFLDPRRGGGALYDLFVHDLDFVLSVIPDTPRLLSANGTMGREGSYRRVSVDLDFGGGCFAQIGASNMMPPRYPFTAAFRAEYEKAALSYTFTAPLNIGADEPSRAELILFENGEATRLPTAENAQTAAFHAEISAFCEGAARGVSPVPPDETLRVMRLVGQIEDLLREADAAQKDRPALS